MLLLSRPRYFPAPLRFNSLLRLRFVHDHAWPFFPSMVHLFLSSALSEEGIRWLSLCIGGFTIHVRGGIYFWEVSQSFVQTDTPAMSRCEGKSMRIHPRLGYVY